MRYKRWTFAQVSPAPITMAKASLDRDVPDNVPASRAGAMG